MSAGLIAAIIAVLELPPRFSRSNQVNTESRYGMKSFLPFFPLLADWNGENYKLLLQNNKKVEIFVFLVQNSK